MATLKQKKAFKLAGENGGNVSKAMRDAGYSPVTAHHTEKLTQSNGWKELMDQHLPDSLLAEKHKELLNKKDKTGEIDINAVSKGLDMAYKLKGKYSPERSLVGHLNFNVQKKESDRIIDEILEG